VNAFESAVATVQGSIFGLLVPEIVLLAGACALIVLATCGVNHQRAGTIALMILLVAGIDLGATAARIDTVETRQEALLKEMVAIRAEQDELADRQRELEGDQRSLEKRRKTVDEDKQALEKLKGDERTRAAEKIKTDEKAIARAEEEIKTERETLERAIPANKARQDANREGWRQVALPLTTSAVVQSRLSLLTRFIAISGGFVLVLFGWGEVGNRESGEYHACLLVLIAGLGLTGAANDLITLFLALELISIPTYVILYLQRQDRPAQEAAAKYFLLSIFSSGMLLFGFSYLYGITGTTNLPSMIAGLFGRVEGARLHVQSAQLLMVVAVVMVVAGLGFKITAVPFHFYAPDVYQGTSTAAAGILAFVPKAAGFIVLLRVLGMVGSGPLFWPEVDPKELYALELGPRFGFVLDMRLPTVLFWILATITMCVGNVLALLQNNVRRLLAYSSVAHAGYMLIGLASIPGLSLDNSGKHVAGGAEAVIFYLVAYGAMTIGAFAVISYLSTAERRVETVDDLAGLGQTHPGVALLMMLFLFSLLGMPLTAGFTGKLLIFFGALGLPLEATLADPEKVREYAVMLRWLALIGAINAAIGGWYYLRVIAAMYLRTPLKPLTPARAWPGLAAMWICAMLTLGLGVYPWPLVKAAHAATVFPERMGDRK